VAGLLAPSAHPLMITAGYLAHDSDVAAAGVNPLARSAQITL